MSTQVVTADSLDNIAICYLYPKPFDLWPEFSLQDFQSSLVFDPNLKINKRCTAYYGHHQYVYGDTVHQPQPISRNVFIQRFVDSLADHFPDSGINSVLVNYYPVSSSKLPYHSDNESSICLKSNIFTLSLGTTREIAFRSAKSKKPLAAIKLKHGSLILFSRASQQYFEHSILPLDKPSTDTTFGFRISLTFRCIIE